MSAFVAGALSALDEIYEEIEKLDPAKENIQLNLLRDEILIYKKFYLSGEDFANIKDEAWVGIDAANKKALGE